MGFGVGTEWLKPSSYSKIEFVLETTSLYFPLLLLCTWPLSSNCHHYKTYQHRKFASNTGTSGSNFLLKTNKGEPILLNSDTQLSIDYPKFDFIPSHLAPSPPSWKNHLFSLSPIGVLLSPLPSKHTHTTLLFCKVLFLCYYKSKTCSE